MLKIVKMLLQIAGGWYKNEPEKEKEEYNKKDKPSLIPKANDKKLLDQDNKVVTLRKFCGTTSCKLNCVLSHRRDTCTGN